MECRNSTPNPDSAIQAIGTHLPYCTLRKDQRGTKLAVKSHCIPHRFFCLFWCLHEVRIPDQHRP